MAKILLDEVDRIEITTLVDNYSDFFLPDTAITRRLRVPPPAGPMAEPGLSFLITVHKEDKSRTVLMDGGITSQCLFHNAEAFSQSLGVLMGQVTGDLSKVEEVFLSHGHFDHFGGLYGFFEKYGNHLPVYVHREAFQDRRIIMGPEMAIPLPTLDREAMLKNGVRINAFSEPTTMAGGWLLASGTVKRGVEFETGSPELEAHIDGEWTTDPFHDDMALAARIKDKGLVVIAGCSHAGIINTVNHLQEITGEDHLHAVLGGFHLSGKNEAIIEPTIGRMAQLAPDHVIPTHCTGWKAIKEFSQAMPEQFILNNVGATHLFGE